VPYHFAFNFFLYQVPAEVKSLDEQVVKFPAD